MRQLLVTLSGRSHLIDKELRRPPTRAAAFAQGAYNGLLLAGFGRVVGLQIRNDFASGVLRDPRAVGPVHFVYFVFPG